MNKGIVIGCLICAQFIVPSWMIASQEKILKTGDVYKFKTAPVDPYDVFRGRYVALSTDQNVIDMQTTGETLAPNQIIYVIIGNDEQGFAKLVSAQPQRPGHNRYIKTRVIYHDGLKLHLDLPFDRYYMNEDKAPQAELLYSQNSRSERNDAYIVIRVLNGKVLIEDLYIGDKPVESYF